MDVCRIIVTGRLVYLVRNLWNCDCRLEQQMFGYHCTYIFDSIKWFLNGNVTRLLALSLGGSKFTSQYTNSMLAFSSQGSGFNLRLRSGIFSILHILSSSVQSLEKKNRYKRGCFFVIKFVFQQLLMNLFRFNKKYNLFFFLCNNIYK